MSLIGSFFPEFRPLFRMLEEPIPTSSPSRALTSSRDFFPSSRDLWYSPLSSFPSALANDQQAQELFRSSNPAFDLQDDGDHYVLKSELPGFKKEDVEIHVSDEGQSITVEGRSYKKTKSRSVNDTQSNMPKSPDTTTSASTIDKPADTTTTNTSAQEQQTVTAPANNANAIQKHEKTVPESTFSSSFKRTLRLPQPTDPDGSRVTAQLIGGVLTLNIPKLVKDEEKKNLRGVRVMIQ